MSRGFVCGWPSLTLSTSQFKCSDRKALLYVTSTGTGEHMEESLSWSIGVIKSKDTERAETRHRFLASSTYAVLLITRGFSCYNYTIRDRYKYIILA